MMRGKKSKDPRASSDWVISGHLEDWSRVAVDHLDGSLDARTDAAVQAHLDSCPECAARLAVQQEALDAMSASALVEVPADLEERILGQLQASMRPTTLAASSARSASRTFRTWAPLAAAAVTVLALGLGFGLARYGSADDAAESASLVAEADEEAYSGDAARTSSDGTDGASDEATATAEADAENVLVETATDSDYFLAGAPTGAGAPDVSRMATALAAAEDPAYFWFSAPDNGTVTREQADAIAQEVTSATGLTLASREFSSGVKAFAAFVPREDAAGMADLLASIGVSMGLSVTLSMQPSSSVLVAWTDAMVKDKYTVAEPTTTTQEPTTTYQTSTTVTSTSTTTVTTAPIQTTLPVDEPTTHVLVVILVAVAD